MIKGRPTQLLASLTLLATVEAVAADRSLCYFEFDQADSPCRLILGQVELVVEQNGSLTKPDGAQRAQVRLPEHFFVESIRYEPTENRMILVFSISDGGSGSSLVSLFDPETFTLLWTTEVQAFNASQPLVVDSAVYLGALGTVAKLDLSTGRQVWVHDDLYEDDTLAYNAFVQPRKGADGIVIFADHTSRATPFARAREVHVRDDTGEILRR